MASKLNIALLSFEFLPDFPLGGIGTYNRHLAQILAQAGAEVHVFAGAISDDRPSEQSGYWVHRVLCDNPADYAEKVVPVFSELHARVNFDVIESPEIHSGAKEVRAKYPTIPMVVRIHAPNHLVESLKKFYQPAWVGIRMKLGALRRGKWLKIYDYREDPEYRFTRSASAITAPSNAMRDWIVENWKISKNQISVIPNPVVTGGALLQLPMNVEPKRILFFGRLNVLKGLVCFTLALKEILSVHPNWEVLVAGEDGPGPNGPSMKAWMESHLHVFGHRIQWHGKYQETDLLRFLADSSIVVIPSLFESFSYACVEAMMAGKAIVAGRDGAMTDLIGPNQNGLLFNPRSNRDLKKALNQLINEPEKRYQLGAGARETVTRCFSTKHQADSLISFYRDIANC